MSSSVTFIMFIYGFITIIGDAEAIKRYYATESCGHVHGPDELMVIEFDQSVDYIEGIPSSEQNLIPPYDLRNTLWECIIVIRGMPTTTGKKYLGIEWRSFHIRDPEINTVEETVEDCGKAYVTMHKGSDTSAPAIRTLCGKDTTRTLFESAGSFLTLRFYADFRRDDSLIQQPPVGVGTSNAACVEYGSVTGGDVTNLPLCQSTPADTYPYPEVHFRVDITSYDNDCEETIQDQVLQCNDSKRCIAWELMCDYYFSHNCKSPAFPSDLSDQTRDAPSYCFRTTTTTPIPTTTLPPPPPPFDWSPIAAAVGGLLALLTLIWCCCRPGYLPWRLARLRNVPLIRDARTCVCCRGRMNCCPCLKCCTAGHEETDYGTKFSTTGVMMVPMVLSKSPWGRRLKASGLANVTRHPRIPILRHVTRPQLHPAQSYGQDPSNFATDWLKLVSGDGGHLREHR